VPFDRLARAKRQNGSIGK